MNLLRRTLIASVTPLLALADTTVNATNYGSGKIATVTDANLITTAGEVTVSSGANLTLQAQTRVSLQPGFKAVSGSTFAARIVDLSPVFTSVAAISATVGGNVSFQVAASGNPTSYAATGLPAGLVINGSTGVISGTTNRFGRIRRDRDGDQLLRRPDSDSCRHSGSRHHADSIGHARCRFHRRLSHPLPQRHHLGTLGLDRECDLAAGWQ
jgi:hypothetical protein